MSRSAPRLPKAGPLLTRALDAATLGAARRLLEQGGRIEDPWSARRGLAGTVVAPNGRRFPVFLVLDGDSRVVEASCSCAPPAERLCAHLAALAVDGAAIPEGPLVGEQFERSSWQRVAAGLLEAAGPEPAAIESTPTGWQLVGRRGAVVATVRGEAGGGSSPEAWVHHPLERRLLDRGTTPEESILELRGSRSRRRELELSPWWVLAKRAFDAVRTETADERIAVEGGALWLVAIGSEWELRLRVSPRAATLIESECPSRLVELGAPLAAGSATLCLSLSLTPEGLVLEPVCSLEREGTGTVVPRGAVEDQLYGPYLLEPDPPSLLAVVAARRPFVEAVAGGGQIGLELGSGYRPSSIGQPLDCRTVVPSHLAADFLLRHQGEISAMPRHLVSAVLAAGVAEPTGAVVRILGREGDRWLLEASYLVAGRSVPAAAVRAARRRREGLLVIEGALVDPLHPRYGWLDQLPDSAFRGPEASHICLDLLEIARMKAWLPESHELIDEACGEGSTKATVDELARLARLEPDQPPPATGLELYDFQQAGLVWLWSLWRHGLGGLLCDDMGLGKTHQAIALIAAIAATEPELPRVLVVCPASVVPHWEHKLAILLPGLPVRRRVAPGAGLEVGVILASYGELRNDAELLAGRRLDLFVLDEIQQIKNRGSATATALGTIEARVAVGLTGTPIENSLEELRSLLEVVLPGYLPSPAAFDQLYTLPIRAGQDDARQRLARVIRPFVLRRLKERVLPGLPEKIEDHRWCSLEPGQAELYQALLERQGRPLLRDLEEGRPQATMHVFALLDRLKRLCDHPALLADSPGATAATTSGKWELFRELLEEALGSGHKVVVFSQYLGMLDLMAAHLDAGGVGHVGLRGSTIDRESPLATFRDDPDCRVFLASLKAGGVGIDLTAASVVIHYDRWWNRAREDQATDRVHRIGQRRGVQVVTLSTRGTVEERIDQIVAEKAELAAGLLPDDDAGLVRRLSREDLKRILR